ncbi:Very-long-chain aldehyde decarbonylase GL1-9 [Linum perenne]
MYAGLYQILPPLDRYRLHTRKEEEKKNLVPLCSVVKGVLIQQLVQIVAAHLLFLIDYCSTRDHHPTLRSSPNHAVHPSNVRNGHVAVLRSSLHAPEQVPIPSHTLPAPPTSRSPGNRSPLQPPTRGSLTRHSRRRNLLPRLRNDSKNRGVLLLLRHSENRRRSLRPMAARQCLPPVVCQQLGLPRHPSSTPRYEVQLLSAVLPLVGQTPGNSYAVRCR